MENIVPHIIEADVRLRLVANIASWRDAVRLIDMQAILQHGKPVNMTLRKIRKGFSPDSPIIYKNEEEDEDICEGQDQTTMEQKDGGDSYRGRLPWMPRVQIKGERSILITNEDLSDILD